MRYFLALLITIFTALPLYADEIPGVDFPIEEVVEEEPAVEPDTLLVEDIPAADDLQEDGTIVYDALPADQLDILPDEEAKLPDLYVHQIIVSPEETNELDEEEVFILESPSKASENSPGIPSVNTIIYRGYFGDRPCFVAFPSEYAAFLTVSDGILINVGPSTVTGRLFYDNELDLTEYSYSLFNLASIFNSNSPNQVYRYGYLSYVRYYHYESGYNVTWSDTYGNFTVEEVVPTRVVGTTENIFYCVLIITLILGMTYIMSWLRFSKNEV